MREPFGRKNVLAVVLSDAGRGRVRMDGAQVALASAQGNYTDFILSRLKD